MLKAIRLFPCARSWQTWIDALLGAAPPRFRACLCLTAGQPVDPRFGASGALPAV